MDDYSEFVKRRLDQLVAKHRFADEESISFDKGRLQTLLADLENQDIQQRSNAAIALGDLATSRAILPLAKAYYAYRRNDEGYIVDLQPHLVRVALAIALYDLGEHRELFDVLFSESGYLKTYITNALRQITG